MRLVFIINTSAQVYTWLHPISEFMRRGYPVRIIARDYGSTTKILKAAGFQFSTFKPVGSRFWRILGTFSHIERCFQLSRGFSPTMFLGFGFDAALTAAFFHRPSIIFLDDDHTIVQNNLTRLFASAIITPNCFIGGLGKRQIRIQGYKELAYLHPNHFTPDITIFNELKIPPGSPYVILRFNVGDAIHDIGWHGFTVDDQIRLVKELERYARVFISPEKPLPPELEKNRISIPYNRIHHALYYAQMFVGDTGTMTSEAAILGTPGISLNAMTIRMGNFNELSHKYDLLYCFKQPEAAIKKALELIHDPDLKRRWAEKRQRLLRDKIDVSRFMIDFIEHYPESVAPQKESGS
jgi:uncharacterized protein